MARGGLRRRGVACSGIAAGRPAGVELAAGSPYAAGDVISGRLSGSFGVPVVLARLERRPEARRAIVVARAFASETDGSFALEIPAAALPTVAGRRCAIAYAVRAGDGDGGAVAEAGVEIVSSAPVHLDARFAPLDRVLREWDARHFHIELTEAVLRGGGVVAGRVHRDRPWPVGPITLEVRCEECWRTRLAFHGVPQWEAAVLWRGERRLDIDPDATWTGFSFALAPWLPPAVEARSVAWRYEVWATRPRRICDETATLTPLVFEDAPRVGPRLDAGTAE